MGTGEAEVKASLARCSRLDASAGPHTGGRRLLTLSQCGWRPVIEAVRSNSISVDSGSYNRACTKKHVPT